MPSRRWSLIVAVLKHCGHHTQALSTGIGLRNTMLITLREMGGKFLLDSKPMNF